VTLRELNRATLARQMLLARETVTSVKAIERLAGLQAQVPRPPFVGLWSRVDGFTREDLIRALRKKQVVRATAMRGTIHLMTAADYVAFHAIPKKTLAALEQEGEALRRFTDEDTHDRNVRRARP
jgi:hypothetical protein